MRTADNAVATIEEIVSAGVTTDNGALKQRTLLRLVHDVVEHPLSPKSTDGVGLSRPKFRPSTVTVGPLCGALLGVTADTAGASRLKLSIPVPATAATVIVADDSSSTVTVLNSNRTEVADAHEAVIATAPNTAVAVASSLPKLMPVTVTDPPLQIGMFDELEL